MKRGSWAAISVIAFTIGLLGAVSGANAVSLWMSGVDRQTPPAYDPVAPFELIDQSGRSFGSQDLSGRVWVADFIFTRCSGSCPLMTAQMKRLHDAFPSVQFVSVSTDPAYDNPEVLKKYADGFGADSGRWAFLSGNIDLVNPLLNSLHLPVISVPEDHAIRLVLVDRQGLVRGYYDPTDTDGMERIKKDIRTLV